MDGRRCAAQALRAGADQQQATGTAEPLLIMGAAAPIPPAGAPKARALVNQEGVIRPVVLGQ